jgi:hypothetical protein
MESKPNNLNAHRAKRATSTTEGSPMTSFLDSLTAAFAEDVASATVTRLAIRNDFRPTDEAVRAIEFSCKAACKHWLLSVAMPELREMGDRLTKGIANSVVQRAKSSAIDESVRSVVCTLELQP